MNTTPDPPAAGMAQIWDLNASNDLEHDGREKTSVYVDVFQSMQDIVMKQERFLFTLEEQACLDQLKEMDYNARYLLIRLCLCQRSKWHTIASIERRYKIEIGGRTNISKAIDDLCGTVHEPPRVIKKGQIDVIDLTIDEDDGSAGPLTSTASQKLDHPKEPGSTSLQLEMMPGPRSSIYAEDESVASLPDLLGCLTYEELKRLGKQLRVTKTGQNRTTLTNVILSNASNQSTLASTVLYSRHRIKGGPIRQLELSFPGEAGMKPQTSVVRRLASKLVGRCIRILPAIFTLFDRLNVVFFRSTSHSPSLLLPALLAAFKKRSHAPRDYVRTASIFPSRQALLDYEAALAIEARIDEAFSGETNAPKRLLGAKRVKEEGALLKSSSRIEGARMVREIWVDLFDRWKAYVNCKQEEMEKSPALERFDCGHVLTRVVYKSAEALAILKEYDSEIEVLEALLAQQKWRRGHRGAWYDRLALVLMTHCEQTQGTLEKALDVVIHGLQDDLTHLIYRPRLQRRLTRLEKRLKIPLSERHKCSAQLNKARDVYIDGVRVRNRASSDVRDKPGRTKGPTAPPTTEWSKFLNPFNKPRASTAGMNQGAAEPSQSWKGKSLWVGRNGEEISVELFAMEYYHGLGFKGFHSEGRIISTIFGLLFWDIIFAKVPGAFETPYQSAPLDIFEDNFYAARQELIDRRLKAIETGEAHELIEKVLLREGQKRTSCIGVDWDFAYEDLLEIVDCLGGHTLAIIGRMICENYGQWRGGVPDLLVWNADTNECRFVEVKSPNDSLQENQKVWIDVIISSNTQVDLCHVAEKREQNKRRRNPRASVGRKGVVSSSDIELEDDFDSESEETTTDPSLNRTKNQTRIYDSIDFVPPPTKKLKLEVVVPQNTRGGSCG